MKYVVFVLTASLGFGAIFVGVEINGHVFPEIGWMVETDWGDFTVKLGATLDEGTLGLKLYGGYSYPVGDFSVGAGGEVLWAVGSGYIVLLGGGASYRIGDWILGGRLDVMLPVGSGKELKGPVPFFFLDYAFRDTL